MAASVTAVAIKFAGALITIKQIRYLMRKRKICLFTAHAPNVGGGGAILR
jgi:hypothetical protein